jgi:predicted transcriptional regulator
MPCRDYESDSWGSGSAENTKLKAKVDKLARIACKAMTALEENGLEDFLVLKDDEVASWWKEHKEADRKEQARLIEKERRERVKAEALSKLSSEERELLGLDSKTGTKKKRVGKFVPTEECLIDLESLLEEANNAWKNK